MEKRYFAGLGDNISLLGFGLMRLPMLARNPKEIDYDEAENMVDRALTAGVNYFDTAWIYHEGQSETFAGAALHRHPREKYRLATKLPTWLIDSPAEAERIFAEQLKKCRVDYFDFYLMHNLNTDNYNLARQHRLYEFLRRKKAKGLIRHLGFSMHDSPGHLRRLLNEYEWDFAQIQLNYIDWDSLKSKILYETLVEFELPVVIMEPVRGGALASLTPEAADILKSAAPRASLASWAIRYAASLPGVMTVLSGMSSLDQLNDNLDVMTGFRPLTEAERGTLARAATAYRAAGAIPCTGCRYCQGCPSGVDIPGIFAIYNHYRGLLPTEPVIAPIVFGNNYRSLADSERADKCVGCGECLSHCPQKIDVPELLKEISSFAAGNLS
jgi:predicted aldo/keto reductase-like oxidoreductase